MRGGPSTCTCARTGSWCDGVALPRQPVRAASVARARLVEDSTSLATASMPPSSPSSGATGALSSFTGIDAWVPSPLSGASSAFSSLWTTTALAVGAGSGAAGAVASPVWASRRVRSRSTAAAVSSTGIRAGTTPSSPGWRRQVPSVSTAAVGPCAHAPSSSAETSTPVPRPSTMRARTRVPAGGVSAMSSIGGSGSSAGARRPQRGDVGDVVVVQDAGGVQEPLLQHGQGRVEVRRDPQPVPRTQRHGVRAEQCHHRVDRDDDGGVRVRVGRGTGGEGGDHRPAGGGLGAGAGQAQPTDRQRIHGRHRRHHDRRLDDDGGPFGGVGLGGGGFGPYAPRVLQAAHRRRGCGGFGPVVGGGAVHRPGDVAAAPLQPHHGHGGDRCADDGPGQPGPVVEADAMLVYGGRGRRRRVSAGWATGRGHGRGRCRRGGRTVGCGWARRWRSGREWAGRRHRRPSPYSWWWSRWATRSLSP